jgi:YegS/Rv2252/BmrU family lipid kinase
MMPKYTIILNPQAKRGKASVLCQQLEKITHEVHVERTTGPQDATLKARSIIEKGAKLVIAAGGDGTINEVLNGIVGTDAVLGIIPFGSVNVLARQLRIPLHFEAAWRVIEQGYIQTIDVVKIDYSVSNQNSDVGRHQMQSRYFVQLAGVGLDAQVVQEVTSEKKKRWGPLIYAFEFLKLVSKPFPKILINIDEMSPLEGEFVLLGNGQYYAGPFSVFKYAALSDGQLDVCIFESMGYWRLLKYIIAIALGTHAKTKGIQYRQGKSMEIHSLSKTPIEIDGEFIGYLPARFTVLPNALKILVPR